MPMIYVQPPILIAVNMLDIGYMFIGVQEGSLCLDIISGGVSSLSR